MEILPSRSIWLLSLFQDRFKLSQTNIFRSTDRITHRNYRSKIRTRKHELLRKVNLSPGAHAPGPNFFKCQQNWDNFFTIFVTYATCKFWGKKVKHFGLWKKTEDQMSPQFCSFDQRSPGSEHAAPELLHYFLVSSKIST